MEARASARLITSGSGMPSKGDGEAKYSLSSYSRLNMDEPINQCCDDRIFF